MTGLFGALNTSTSGLRAQQAALQTTSHNLANANTEGYSRQRVTMEANVPQSYAGIGQIGTGVILNGITRVTDEFVTMQLQNEQASLTRFQQESDIIGQLEAIYNEPSTTGIANQLSEFFVSWSNLASNPESVTSKTMVIRQTETFLDTVNHASNKMEQLAGETLNLMDKDVLDFNNATVQIKALNDQIFNATVKGEMPNDLLDKLDQLVGDLKNIAGVEVDTSDKYGRAFINFGEKKVVTASEVNELQVKKPALDADKDANKKVVFYVGKATDDPAEIKANKVDITSGSLKGLTDARIVVLDKQTELHDFMDTLTDAVNMIHSDGNPGVNDPAIGMDFITKEANGRYEVNDDLLADPSILVTGIKIDNSIAGDGSRAKAIADLQNTSLSSNFRTQYTADSMSFTNVPAGSTIFNQYNEMVTNMGIVKQQADNMVTNQTDLTALLEQRHASISGVDINEEVVNMIQFQSAFQANSRMISTLAEMLDTLINRTGV